MLSSSFATLRSSRAISGGNEKVTVAVFLGLTGMASTFLRKHKTQSYFYALSSVTRRQTSLDGNRAGKIRISHIAAASEQAIWVRRVRETIGHVETLDGRFLVGGRHVVVTQITWHPEHSRDQRALSGGPPPWSAA